MFGFISKIYTTIKLFFTNMLKSLSVIFLSILKTTFLILLVILFINFIIKCFAKEAYVNLEAEDVLHLNFVTNAVYGYGSTDSIEINPPLYDYYQNGSGDINISSSSMFINVLTNHFIIFDSSNINNKTTPINNEQILYEEIYNNTKSVTFSTNNRVLITKFDNTQLKYSFDASSLFKMRYFQKRPSRDMVNYKTLFNDYDIQFYLHGLDEDKILNDDYILKLDFLNLTVNNHVYENPVTVILYGYNEIKTHCSSIRFENEIYKDYNQNWNLFNIEDFYAKVTGNLSFDLFNSPKEYDLFERDVYLIFNYNQNIVDIDTDNIKCKIINENESSKLNIHGIVNDAGIGNSNLFKNYNNKWSFILALIPIYIKSIFQGLSVKNSNSSK